MTILPTTQDPHEHRWRKYDPRRIPSHRPIGRLLALIALTGRLAGYGYFPLVAAPVRGQLVDEDSGHPIDDAVVQLSHSAKCTVGDTSEVPVEREAYTDAQGRFAIDWTVLVRAWPSTAA
ncbi:MAG: hypothetical protein C5B48_08460 [Candidatus Rokuibacteriota bacterium]|nr:MAG: hypothetical protein C5B48_08460 [Candidatus Rokubacteria bacterium]